MRLVIRVLLCLLFLVPVGANAGDITSKPGATFHILNGITVLEIEYELGNGIRHVADLSACQPVIVPKSKSLYVIGYASTSNDVMYNAYIVKYKGKMAILSEDDVLDNSTLIAECDKEQGHYDSLRYAETIKASDEAKDRLTRQCTDSVQFHENRIAALKERIEQETSAQVRHIQDSLRNVVADYLTTKEKKEAPYGKVFSILRLNDAYLDGSNSVGGHDVVFAYTNLSKKVIKYLQWNANIKNAVGDNVSCEITGKYSFTGKDTGPVLPGEKNGGTWENVIYNWSARTIDLKSVSITYTDGSTASLTAKELMAASALMDQEDIMKTTEGLIKAYENPKGYNYSEIRRQKEKLYAKTIKASEDRISWFKRAIKSIQTGNPEVYSSIEKKNPYIGEYEKVYMKSLGARKALEEYRKRMNL